MLFPDVPRVIYEVNPLEEVICQLRFLPVLKIDTEPPAGFQEEIRAEYPLYESKSPLRLPAGLPSSLVQMILPLGGQKLHEFTSQDRTWSVSLGREFLALTCRAYERWEFFRKRLEGPLEALRKHYDPPFLTRIGLRYRDVVRRSRLQLAEMPWSELLQPWISSVLAMPEAAKHIQGVQTQFVLNLPEETSRVQVWAGLVHDGRNNENCFLVDSDFYTEQQTEPSHVFDRLNAFNHYARRFFRWCITDRLHEAMRPHPVSSL
jgi:uncharacterized protein (TIGR04255 family)